MGRKKIWEKKKKFSKQKKTDKNKFKLKKRDLRELEKKGLVKEGMFIGNQKGFGFVELEDEEDDILSRQMRWELLCTRIRCGFL